MKAPLVEVVEHRREDRSGPIGTPETGIVYLCGIYVSVDRLSCGHTVEIAGGGKAKRRRCTECGKASADEGRMRDREGTDLWLNERTQ